LGRVSVIRHDSLWALAGGDIVQPNEEIVAEADGHAILQLPDTSHVEVFPNSRLIFHSNHGNWKDLLDLILGKVRVHIEKIGGQPNPYRMFSPTALIAVRGTTFDVEVDSNTTTVVTVEEGVVRVDHRLRPTKSVDVGQGESLTIYANEPIAKSQVDKVRTAARILVDVAERTMEILRTVAASKVPGTVPTTPSSTSTTTTPTATVGGSQSGSGTTTPPSNGRGSGSGNNGDQNPGTGTPPTGPGGGGQTPTPAPPSGSNGSGSNGSNPATLSPQSRQP
jgi:hypothetical protein